MDNTSVTCGMEDCINYTEWGVCGLMYITINSSGMCSDYMESED